MMESPRLGFSLIAGALLGIFFYGGLWWTIEKGVRSNQPGVLFAGSLIVRLTITMLGFYFVTGQQLSLLASCFIGFFAARLLVTSLIRRYTPQPVRTADVEVL